MRARGGLCRRGRLRVRELHERKVRRGVVLEPLDPKVIKMLDLQAQMLERVRAKLDLDRIPVERLGDEELWQKTERAIVDLVGGLEQSGELPKYVDRDGLIKETINEALGLGPLEDLLAEVWDIHGAVSTRTVDVHVRRLRASLGDAADMIETVHGFGYRARRDPGEP